MNDSGDYKRDWALLEAFDVAVLKREPWERSMIIERLLSPRAWTEASLQKELVGALRLAGPLSAAAVLRLMRECYSAGLAMGGAPVPMD